MLMFVLLISIATFALIPGWLLGLSIDTIISGGLTQQNYEKIWVLAETFLFVYVGAAVNIT